MLTNNMRPRSSSSSSSSSNARPKPDAVLAALDRARRENRDFNRALYLIQRKMSSQCTDGGGGEKENQRNNNTKYLPRPRRSHSFSAAEDASYNDKDCELVFPYDKELDHSVVSSREMDYELNGEMDYRITRQTTNFIGKKTNNYLSCGSAYSAGNHMLFS